MLRKKNKSGNVDTLIADGTCINGDLTFSGALFVDGEIKGEIRGDNESQSVLSIGVHGRVEGNISTPYAIIFGEVDGDVYISEKVDLKPGAKVNGDLYYKVIEMNAGAEVNGKMVVVGDPKALEHKAEDVIEKKSKEPTLDDTDAEDSEQHSVEAEPAKA